MPARMRAVRQRSFGGPEVLELAEVDRPVPLATEVLVRSHAVGVNPVEPLIRSGQFPLLGAPPFILGWDVSGVVEDLEPGVTRFSVGDEVYGMPFFPRAASAYADRPPTSAPAPAASTWCSTPSAARSPAAPSACCAWPSPAGCGCTSRPPCRWPRRPRLMSSWNPAERPSRSPLP